jgi:hypothetical protein
MQNKKKNAENEIQHRLSKYHTRKLKAIVHD